MLWDWHQDLNKMLDFNHVAVAEADAIYVGVGTGHDLDVVLPHAKSLAVTDVSRGMLAQANAKRPGITAHLCAAEALVGIDDKAIDLYMSLRVYQSSLFSILRAVHRSPRHVQRVASQLFDPGPRT